jgi:hypothetical protein
MLPAAFAARLVHLYDRCCDLPKAEEGLGMTVTRPEIRVYLTESGNIRAELVSPDGSTRVINVRQDECDKWKEALIAQQLKLDEEQRQEELQEELRQKERTKERGGLSLCVRERKML